MAFPTGRWIPAYVVALMIPDDGYPMFVSKWKIVEKSGPVELWAWYVNKHYSTPAPFVIIADPRAFSVRNEGRIKSCMKGKGLHGDVRPAHTVHCRESWGSKAYYADLNPGFYIVRVNPERHSMEMLIPRRPVDAERVRWTILILQVWQLGATTYSFKDVYSVAPSPVYSAAGSSSSGAHWEKVYVIALDRKRGEKARIEIHHCGKNRCTTYTLAIDAEGKLETS